MMKITTYWEKVDRTGCKEGEWGKVLKGEYVVKDVTSYPNNGGWKDPEDFKRHALHRTKFMGREQGGFRFDIGTYCGIHSYQIISFH